MLTVLKVDVIYSRNARKLNKKKKKALITSNRVNIKLETQYKFYAYFQSQIGSFFLKKMFTIRLLVE